MAFVSALLALTAEAGLLAPPAHAREARYTIDIPAGRLSESLTKLSEITGISVGLAGSLPQTSSRRVTGSMAADAALRKLLQGTGLRAVRVSPTVYRVEKMVTPRRIPTTESARDAETIGPTPDIVVTAQKRPQMLSTVPLSLSIVSMSTMEGSRAPTSQDVSLGTEGLAMTNLGPGRNRQFIRGVADSPFNGQSQSTVSVQVDEARVTFNAPDPDLRLVDVDRVEILKGPQGPLYGSGALGGIYHVVTRRPDLAQASASMRFSVQGVQHGTLGTGAEGIFNLPIMDDRLAVRATGYRFMDAGWINTAAKKNSNSTETVGFRVGGRWQPFENWTVDAGFALQDINSRDSQYVVANDDTLKRMDRIPEPTDNDFKLYHGTIQGDIGDLHLLLASSYVDHGFDYVLDASAAATDFGLTGPARFEDERHYTISNHEVRLSSSGVNHWLAGISYLRTTTHGEATVTGDDGVAQSVETIDRVVKEYALFGEGTVRLFSFLDATLGARLYHSEAVDETMEQVGQRDLRRGKTIVSPSFALSAPWDEQGIIYLRYARAMRPGGLAPGGETSSGRFEADELSTFDLGVRRSSSDGRLSFSASGYFTLWNDIQSDYLRANGLVSTRNAGKGKIIGLEGSVDWKLGGGFAVEAGGSIQSARLTHANGGLKLDDRRLPIAPEISGRLSLTENVTLGEWHGVVSAQANYFGRARLSLDDDLDREMGKYVVAAFNSQFSNGPLTIGARLDNVLDVKGDSFAFGNPFSIRTSPQYTPLRPRTLTLSLARRW